MRLIRIVRAAITFTPDSGPWKDLIVSRTIRSGEILCDTGVTFFATVSHPLQVFRDQEFRVFIRLADLSIIMRSATWIVSEEAVSA